MTVNELVNQLAQCQPNDLVFVPCLGCGDNSEAVLLRQDDGAVVIMCKACAGK